MGRLIPRPTHVRQEGVVNIVQSFGHHRISAVRESDWPMGVMHYSHPLFPNVDTRIMLQVARRWRRLVPGVKGAVFQP